MADESAKIDVNHQKALLGVTNAATPELRNLKVDATTSRLLVSATVSGISTITIANEATDTTCFPLFATAATGSLQPKTNAGLTFNSNTANFGSTLMNTQKLTVGVAGTATGSIELNGTTSGTVTLKVADEAGTWTMTLPANDGDNGQVLTTNGSGVCTWSAAGSGANTALSNLASVAINTSLISDTDNTDDLGSSDKSWKDLYIRTIKIDGSTSGTVTIQGAAEAGTYTLTLPTSDGSANQLLQTDGSGVLSWANEGANKALSNLASLAINTSLIPGADVSVNMGTGDLRYKDMWVETISAGLTAADTLKLRGRDVDGAAYVDILTITSNNTVTADLNAITTIGGNAIIYSGGALGTPSGGTLTNCSGLPVSGITDSTSEALGVGSIELGHASDTTLSRSAAGVLQVEGVVVPTISSTNTLTNKRITKRVLTFTSDATPDVDSDSYDAVTITAQAAAITDVNVTGTPTNFQTLLFRIKDDGTARAIAWGSDFEAGSKALPTTTVAGKTLLVGFIYDSVDSKWACEASGSRS